MDPGFFLTQCVDGGLLSLGPGLCSLITLGVYVFPC